MCATVERPFNISGYMHLYKFNIIIHNPAQVYVHTFSKHCNSRFDKPARTETCYKPVRTYRFPPSVLYIHTDTSAWKMEATQVTHARPEVLKVVLAGFRFSGI
jgi:hypothetical protein